jgi:hypothetical protein
MKSVTLLTSLLAVAALAACGGDDDSADVTAPQTSVTTSTASQTSGSAPGPAHSIEDALAADSDEPQLVIGNVLATREEIRLCSALAESFPPQCGGASVHVRGLDLEKVDGLITGGDVSWTDRPVVLLGVVFNHLQAKDDVLTVSKNAP